MSTSSQRDLRTMFPGVQVMLSNKETIVVTPIMLSDLPKVLDAVDRIMELMGQTPIPSAESVEAAEERKKAVYVQLVTKGMRELLDILPYCIDKPLTEIPATEALPELITALIDQNFSELTRGKWMALFEKAKELLAGQGLPDRLGKA